MKNKIKVAVASRSFSKNPILRAELLEKFEFVSFNETGQSLSGGPLIRFLAHHERAITALEVIDADLLKNLPDLKLISKYGVGLDMLDLSAMHRQGVQLGWSSGVNKRSVAELALGFAMALLRGVPMAHHEVRHQRWAQYQGRELTGKTVGIIGCGNVGQELIRFLKPFHCNILVSEILDNPNFFSAHEEVQRVDLNTLLKQSDVVSLHIPLNASTRDLMNRTRLTLMKKGSVLINTARGNIVDEGALKDLLKAGHLWGAGFDVFGNEPPLDGELLELPQFLATPHIGGSSIEAVLAMGRSAIDNLQKGRDALELLD